MLDDKFVLPEIGILGQITVLYARSNTGKTLILLKLITEAATKGDLRDLQVLYINADDTYKGQIEKAKICKEFDIQALVPNQSGFKNENLLRDIKKITEAKLARNVVLVVDTLKKYTDLMDKKLTSQFTALAREFVQMGGTLILTAHTNKHERDGEPIPGGTSDLLDDADCAYTLQEIGVEGDVHTVEFKQKKSRGDVAEKVLYQYDKAIGQGYVAMFNSVTKVDGAKSDSIKLRSEAINSLTENYELIKVIATVIMKGNGKLPKGDVVKETRKISGESMHKVRRVIQLHEGDNYNDHYRWALKVEGGRHKYQLLPGTLKHE